MTLDLLIIGITIGIRFTIIVWDGMSDGDEEVWEACLLRQKVK
jgi:hypothetical protein